MANSIGPRTSSALREQLDRHPIYAEVRDLGDLRLFMAHHVYAVWDFMSLVKYVQGHIAPVSVPWMPTAHPSMLRQFINAMVLAEESDEGLPDATGQPTAVAHFDLYCHAMREVGADTGVLMRFLEQVRTDGVRSALGAAEPYRGRRGASWRRPSGLSIRVRRTSLPRPSPLAVNR